MLQFICPQILVFLVGSTCVPFPGKSRDFLVVGESLPLSPPLSAEIAVPHPGTCCAVQLPAMPCLISRSHPMPQLSHGICDSQSKPTKDQWTLSYPQTLSILLMSPHFINPRNFYVKYLDKGEEEAHLELMEILTEIWELLLVQIQLLQ